MSLNRRYKSGEQVRAIKAQDLNRITDAARAEVLRRNQQLPDEGLAGRPIALAKVRNNDAGAGPRCAAVALRDPIITPTANLPEFQRLPTFEGYVAEAADLTSAADPSLVGIFLGPVEAGAIGDCVIDGVVPCKVDIQTAGDRFAELDIGATTLTSSATGSVEILWAESGTGIKWCLVRVGGLRHAYREVQDESTPVTNREILAFIGAQVKAEDDAANERTKVEIWGTIGKNGYIKRSAGGDCPTTGRVSFYVDKQHHLHMLYPGDDGCCLDCEFLCTPTVNLVVELNMEETGGTRADGTANGYDFTESAPTIASDTGIVDLAAKFDGTKFLLKSHEADFNSNDGARSIGVALWANFDAVASDQILSQKGTAWKLWYDNAADRLKFLFGDTTVAADALGAVQSAVWYYVVAWFDVGNGKVKINVNETNENEAVFGTASDTADEVRIGEDFAGLIDEYKLFLGCPPDPWITFHFGGGSGPGGGSPKGKSSAPASLLQGGTGAATAKGARTNLGVPKVIAGRMNRGR